MIHHRCKVPGPLFLCGLAVVSSGSLWSAVADPSSIERSEMLDQTLQTQISSAQDAESSAQQQQADAAEDEIQASVQAIRARQQAAHAIEEADANATYSNANDDRLRTHLRHANAELQRSHEETARATAALRVANDTARRESEELQQLQGQVAADQRNQSRLEAELRQARAEGEQRLDEAQAESQRAFDSQVGAVMGQDTEHFHEREAHLQRNVAATEARVTVERRRSASMEQDENQMRFWLLATAAALAAAALAAGGFYFIVVRMRRQRTYHMSVILRLNTERIKCVDRIKELSVPILEADAAEEAILNGSTGCA